jgi:hypothetical protein
VKEIPDFSGSIQKLHTRKWETAYHLKFTFFFYIRIEISSQKTLVKSVMSKVNAFIEIIRQWNTAIKVSGTTLWWQITAGCCTVMLQT